MEPKRLKKQLPKILKLLKPEDRILIVGTTHRPFDAELQSFCRVYQKIILVPRPDYASRYGKYLSPLPGCRPRGRVVPYGLKGVWSRGRGGRWWPLSPRGHQKVMSVEPVCWRHRCTGCAAESEPGT